MIAIDLNIDIKICPCCEGKFDQNKIIVNNEVYGDLLCLPCLHELEKYDCEWQSNC